MPYANDPPDVDAVVVGAGFAGLYLIHRLRGLGLSVLAFESGADVGGTWYWNRYPGARCDIQSIDYSYSFDRELEAEWTWSERYATQPEILAYLQHVADRHDLKRAIRFETRVRRAAWQQATDRWQIETDDGASTTCRWYIMASGCLSSPKAPEIPGFERFRGDTWFTSRWPHAGVDFSGQRVAVIGTGSSGIQSIPIIAGQARELTVFQRTPNFSVPAANGAPEPDKQQAFDADPAAYRDAARWSAIGVPGEPPAQGAFQVTPAERRARFEQAWAHGTIYDLNFTFNDILSNPEANAAAAEFVRERIRAKVDDPATAETLCPTSYPIGSKRICLDDGYFETFNQDHVHLVDLRATPIEAITEHGIDVVAENGAIRSCEFDAIVFATGFDALTGAVVAVDITGRDGATLAERWADGPQTYLGLMSVGFPNLFMVTGPQSPSVLSNMAVSIEQHVEWIADAIATLTRDGHRVIEPTPGAQAAWVRHNNDFADITLFPQADSWYMGANVPGKPRVVLPYVGGVDRYRRICNDVIARGYLGFSRRGPAGAVENDGTICRLQPDVMVLLDALAELQLPPFESLSATDARALNDQMAAANPPGPAVGEVVDGVLPGADGGERAWRLYRPDSDGPHPVTVYFHGGGWVLGSAVSDDAFCRDLCARSDSLIVSVDYRHAPEHRFPAAPDDAFAAVTWVAAHAESLGGIAGPVALAGWSAGGNLAAVTARRARDAGAPEIAGQLLLAPVTDRDLDRASYHDSADGYILTRALMAWFWDHYADAADRADPDASPLRAARLAGLAPATVVTCEFDPLRDEGAAYVRALADAGVAVEHIDADGHIHTSMPMVGVIATGEAVRARMGRALRAFFGETVAA